jgi:hypothetical protein
MQRVLDELKAKAKSTPTPSPEVAETGVAPQKALGGTEQPKVSTGR